MESGSTQTAEINPTTGMLTNIVVDGTATIEAGTTLGIDSDGALYLLGSQTTVLSTTGGLTGTYSVIDATPTPFLSLTDIYDSNNAYLQAAQIASLASAGQTFNQTRTAAGIDSLPSTSLLRNAVLSLSSFDDARHAFDLLSGEIYASANMSMLEDTRFARAAAGNRIRNVFCDTGRSPEMASSAQEGESSKCGSHDDERIFWGQGYGSWGHNDGDGNAARLSRSTGGLFLGVDIPVTESWRAGILAGYGHTNFDVDDRSSSGDSDNYQLGIYGGTQQGPLGFHVAAIHAWHDVSVTRTVGIPNFSDRLQADYTVETTQISGDLGYKIYASPYELEPFASLSYVHLQTDGFTENGGEAALHVGEDNINAGSSTLGVRVMRSISIGNAIAELHGSAGWVHAFGDVAASTTMALDGGNAFEVSGAPIARNAAAIEAGLDFSLSPDARIDVSYSGRFGGGSDQGLQARLTLQF